MGRYVVGVSGASGVVLAMHLLRTLTNEGHKVELIFTKHALYVAALEIGKDYAHAEQFLSYVKRKELITLYSNQDIGAAVASGSFLTDGMIIIPCSMTTIAAITCGLGDNLLRRAADVTLKEKRSLILVPRESPLSEIHLKNMLILSRRGATIIPPVPAWYIQAKTIEDIEKFIVGRVLDILRIEHNLYLKWKSKDVNSNTM
ncbi:MAG: UbiX family flavin prenyltransferase [Chlamydiales bacterium]